MSASTNYTDEMPPSVTSEGTDVDTATLVWMIQSKSELGFQILYDQYSGALYGLLMKFVRSTDVANDLLQDVFVEIWKHIDSYNPDRGTLFTWMLNITRNRAIDYSRSTCQQPELRHTRIEVFVFHEDDAGVDSSINYLTELDNLQNQSTHFDTNYTEVIDMIFFYGFTYEQTAQILNMPLGTVKIRAKKGLSILKNIYLP